MNAEIWVAAATAVSVALTGWFTSRASSSAAKATAEAQRAAAIVTAKPAEQAVSLTVLEATVARVDEENGQLRLRVSRTEALLRAFAWTCDRWAGQMRAAHIEPESAHPLVEEYNRTGV